MTESDHTTVSRGPNGEVRVAIKQTALDALTLVYRGFKPAEAKAIAELKRKAEEGKEDGAD